LERLSKVRAFADAGRFGQDFLLPIVGLKRFALFDAKRSKHRGEEPVALLDRLLGERLRQSACHPVFQREETDGGWMVALAIRIAL
jgi:hypothetical protein